jgi:septal ring factor EnvC (AmiA/AmiB activator)
MQIGGRRWAEVDFGEKIIIWMIGVEILLAICGILLTIYEANSQDAVLKNILTAQDKVDTDLGTVNTKLGELNAGINQTVSNLDQLNAGIKQTVRATTESAASSEKINEALGSEIRVLSQQQKTLEQQGGLLNQQLDVLKEQWERQNQHPEILVFTIVENKANPGNDFRELLPMTYLGTGHSAGHPNASIYGNRFLSETSETLGYDGSSHRECHKSRSL